MIKRFRFVQEVGEVISAASEEVVSEVLREYPANEIRGREEEITAVLRHDLNGQLMRKISENLDGKEVNGVEFKVYTFKKKDENKIGADLSGIVEYSFQDQNGRQRRLAKGFLAQAKVCRFNTTHIRGDDSKILGQAEKMLSITSDSFFFCYTGKGIYAMSALQVNFRGKNSLDSREVYAKSLGTFYEELFKCFIGDHKIAPLIDRAQDLEKIAEEYRAGNVLYIKASANARGSRIE